ncbi:MAG TPA: hypothetical protein VIG51_09685 [Candidatus Baltobacteraceae bacterium]|jgi:hypothetical protein
MTKLRTAALAAALIAVAGCATTKPSSPADVTTARENAGVANLKQTYSGVVEGTDVNGATLRVYVDINGIDSMDESAEDAMKQQLLARWKRVWAKNNPGKHATLAVELHDFQGKLIFTETTKA